MTAPAVDVASVRRWVRRRQSAHRDRRETFSNFYFALLFVAIVGGMLHRQVQAVFWPVRPNASITAGAALTLLLVAALYLAMRRIGPVGLSRPAASWLLTAPVDRRRLLLPTLRWATLLAGLAGALSTVAIVGHVAPRPLPGVADALVPGLGAVLGAAILLVALAAQAGRRWPAVLDQAAYGLIGLGLAGLVADTARGGPRATGDWPAAPVLLTAAAAVALVVLVCYLLSVRGLARVPAERVLESARTAGTLADSVYGVEPSFVAEMLERRYWSRRRLRSRTLWHRVPVLVAQDLLVVCRRPRRLLFLAAAIALPALLSHAPGWVLGLAVLSGGMLAGATPTSTLRTDAGNPWLLRMMGLSSRAVVLQRLWVPGVLAAVWYCASLALLTALGVLPSGPWWALGLALGPVGALAAVRRARVGFVDNGLLPLDTPVGSISMGPLISGLIGYDGLLFGLPALVALGFGDPLTWTGVLVQAAVGVLGVRLYLHLSTKDERVELAEPV